MQEVILVLDVGTTNFKTFLFDLSGAIVFSRHRPFRPSYEADGLVLQNPLDWKDALLDGASGAAKAARERGLAVVALSLTASRSSVIPLDADGNHLGPAMMWQETASRDIVNRLGRHDSARIYKSAGSRPNTVYSAPKMAWLRLNQPQVYAKARKLAGIQDYLIRFLTGNFVTDHSFASRTLLMDIRKLAWDPALLELFQVDRDKLCDLVPPGSVAGSLTAAAAAATGLAAGVPVVTAGGDQQCAALGLGVFRQGDAMVNLGTGSFLVATVDTPVVDAAMRVMVNASAIPGKWTIDAGMLATGSVHRWFAENFYPEIPEGDPAARYARFDAEAAQSPPGASGLFVLPHFSGKGAPQWENRAKGAFYGMTLRHRRGDIARAVLEGIACEIAATLAVADELVGLEADFRLAGGLAQSRFFDQLLADVTGRGIRLSASHEATARGAWSQAMVALGKAGSQAEALARENGNAGKEERFRPDPDLAGTYEKIRAERERLFACLSAMRDGE